MGKKIEYSNGELTIIWQPELCATTSSLWMIGPKV